MASEATIKTPIPTTSGFHNFALSTLTFAFSTRPPPKPPILPSSTKNYDLFMQNKANFRNEQMNISSFITSKYENLDIWWTGKNKVNQSQSQRQKMLKQARPFCYFCISVRRELFETVAVRSAVVPGRVHSNPDPAPYRRNRR
jgi:hypothetical protein